MGEPLTLTCLINQTYEGLASKTQKLILTLEK